MEAQAPYRAVGRGGELRLEFSSDPSPAASGEQPSSLLLIGFALLALGYIAYLRRRQIEPLLPRAASDCVGKLCSRSAPRFSALRTTDEEPSAPLPAAPPPPPPLPKPRAKRAQSNQDGFVELGVCEQGVVDEGGGGERGSEEGREGGGESDGGGDDGGENDGGSGGGWDSEEGGEHDESDGVDGESVITPQDSVSNVGVRPFALRAAREGRGGRRGGGGMSTILEGESQGGSAFSSNAADDDSFSVVHAQQLMIPEEGMEMRVDLFKPKAGSYASSQRGGVAREMEPPSPPSPMDETATAITFAFEEEAESVAEKPKDAKKKKKKGAKKAKPASLASSCRLSSSIPSCKPSSARARGVCRCPTIPDSEVSFGGESWGEGEGAIESADASGGKECDSPPSSDEGRSAVQMLEFARSEVSEALSFGGASRVSSKLPCPPSRRGGRGDSGVGRSRFPPSSRKIYEAADSAVSFGGSSEESSDGEADDAFTMIGLCKQQQAPTNQGILVGGGILSEGKWQPTAPRVEQSLRLRYAPDD